jgi:hypothetical protein
MSPVRCGIHAPLEQAANELIFGSLKGITSQKDKSDVLTPWKENDRRSKEVLTSSGFPDAQIRRGMFHRVLNREKMYLNSREGIAPAFRTLTIAAAGNGYHEEGQRSDEDD